VRTQNQCRWIAEPNVLGDGKMPKASSGWSRMFADQLAVASTTVVVLEEHPVSIPELVLQVEARSPLRQLMEPKTTRQTMLCERDAN